MRRTFAGRRAVPRKIGAEDEEPSGEQPGTDMKRPQSSKPKKSSHLRLSYLADDDEGDGERPNFVSKQRNLKNRVVPRPRGEDESKDRSRLVFSQQVLDELKEENWRANLEVPMESIEIELETSAKPPSPEPQPEKKMPTLDERPVRPRPMVIPSEAEIREKKDRRARLAKEAEAEEYISLEQDNEDDLIDPDMRHLLRDRQPRQRAGSDSDRSDARSADVHDDEDVLEGFDAYVEDERLALSRKAQKATRQQRRDAIAAAIAAQHGAAAGASATDDADAGTDASDASDADRAKAFEKDQMRAAASNALHARPRPRPNGRSAARPRRARTPPQMPPPPDLATLLARTRNAARITAEQIGRETQRLASLRDEDRELEAYAEHIQTQLRAKGQEYERARAEVMAGQGVGEAAEGMRTLAVSMAGS